MAYEVNPCKACNIHLGKDGDINSLNNCLVETASAFSSFPSTNVLRGTNAANNWDDCIGTKMTEIGRAPCNYQLNMAPVFVQVPHPPPKRLDELKDKDKALAQALLDCKSHNLPNECKIHCQIDYDAVVMASPPNTLPQPLRDAPLARGTQQCITETYETPITTDPTFADIAKDRTSIFWSSFLIVGLMLSFVIVMFISILITKK